MVVSRQGIKKNRRGLGGGKKKRKKNAEGNPSGGSCSRMREKGYFDLKNGLWESGKRMLRNEPPGTRRYRRGHKKWFWGKTKIAISWWRGPNGENAESKTFPAQKIKEETVWRS